MFLLYVDASGVPELVASPPAYAMVGLCLHEGAWFGWERRVNDIKRQYALPGVDFELHAKEFCTQIVEQEEVPNFEQLDRPSRRRAVLGLRRAKLEAGGPGVENRRKKYGQTDAFVHLTRGERSKLLEDALDLIGSHDGLRLFGEVVDKSYLVRTGLETNAIRTTFAQVVSRFDAFLTYFNSRTVPNSAEHGMLVMDQEPTYESYLRNIFNEYRERGHPWGPLNYVIETPFFIDSRTASAVQAVDLCSYAVRRHAERPTGSPYEEANLRRIFHKFDRAGPKLHGLRHFCPRGACRCLICRDRGHDAPLNPPRTGET